MTQTNESPFVVVPMIDGETIQRRYQRNYPERAKTSRQHPVNLSDVPELLALLRGVPDGPAWPEGDPHGDHMSGMIEQARRHLHDAANEALPDDVRIQHLDIAGSLVWNARDIEHFTVPTFDAFMNGFIRAGGA